MKMRVNKNPDAYCEECECLWKHTEEMYDLMLCGNVQTICKQCAEELFRKLLRKSCAYNAKVKSPEDMQRIQKAKDWRENRNDGHKV